MRQILTGAAIAAALQFGAAQAATFDFTTAIYDQTNLDGTFLTFTDGAGTGINLVISAIGGTALVPANGNIGSAEGDNQTNALPTSPDAGSINLLNNAGNSVTLSFRFLNGSGVAQSLDDLKLGFYDLDFLGGEIVDIFAPVSVTTASPTTITASQEAGFVRLSGSGEVTNPTSFTNLSGAQAGAGALVDFGDDVDELILRFSIGNVAGASGIDRRRTGPQPLRGGPDPEGSRWRVEAPAQRSSIMISRLPTGLAGLTTPCRSISSTSLAALLYPIASLR
jgi:hypothetical protein